MKYRPDIDGLRTIAVVPVILFHAGLGFTGGYVGVDVFFVISGFLITTILWTETREGRFSIIRFYERRARRIFPALFAMAAVTAVLAWVLLLPPHLDDFGESLVATAVFASNVYFYLKEGYFTEAAHLKPLLHTWSLAVEEQYYIVFPPLLWALARLGGAARVALILALLSALSLGLAAWTVARDPTAAFYLPHTRAWELLLGSLLAIAVAEGWLNRVGRHRGAMAVLAFAGLGLILWPVFAYSAETPFPGLAALPPCLGTALLIATAAQGSTPVSRALSLAPMVFVGKISYSLYLWHWPVLVFAGYAHVDPLSPALALACIALTFGLATLSWRYVEAPFRTRRWGATRPRLFAGSGAAIAASLAIGAVLLLNQGFPGRMPQIARLLDHTLYLHAERDCHFRVRQQAHITPADLCVRGAEGATPSFVLAGDSHADALSPAVFAAARALGVSGYHYTNPGFRPLLGVDQQGRQHQAEQAATFARFLRETPQVRTVVVTAFWIHQATGGSYRHAGDVWYDDAYDGSGTAYNPTALVHGLSRLAEAFPDRRFVLLDDGPSGDPLDMRTHARALRFKGAGVRDTAGLAAADYARQRATWEPLLEEVAAAYANVEYLPVFQRFCGPALCPLFDGETPLFRDGDHVSPEGAATLVPALERALAPVLETAHLDPAR